MGEHPCVGWWLHQAGEEPSSSWLLDNPSPSTGETSALTRMDTGLWPTPGFSQGDWVWSWMIFEVHPRPFRDSQSPLLGGFRCLRGLLHVRCFSSTERGLLGCVRSLHQGEFGDQTGKKQGEAARKEQSSSLRSRLNDLHQAEGPWQENEVTSALNHSPED